MLASTTPAWLADAAPVKGTEGALVGLLGVAVAEPAEPVPVGRVLFPPWPPGTPVPVPTLPVPVAMGPTDGMVVVVRVTGTEGWM